MFDLEHAMRNAKVVVPKPLYDEIDDFYYQVIVPVFEEELTVSFPKDWSNDLPDSAKLEKARERNQRLGDFCMNIVAEIEQFGESVLYPILSK